MGIDPNKLVANNTPATFSDNFNGSAASELWNAQTNVGKWDTLNGPTAPGSYSQAPTGSQMNNPGEQEWFINENYTNVNSDRVSSPFTFGSGLTIQGSPLSGTQQQALGTTAPYESGAVTSYHSYAQTYGYFEMDATLSDSFGAWPGFWLEPDSVQGAAGNKEIDVIEQYITQDPASKTTFYSTIHDQPDNLGTPPQYAEGETGTTTDTGMYEHRFGVDIEKDNITFWVGTPTGGGSWTYSQVGPAFPTLPAFQGTDGNGLPMYMIADLAFNAIPTDNPWIHINSIEAYASGPTGGYVYTGDASYTATPGVGYIFLQADASQGPQTVTANDAGDVIGSVSFNGTIPGDPNSGGIPQDPNRAQGGDANHHPANTAIDNTMVGGAGADTIYLSAGDTATGGAGDDTFVLDDQTYDWQTGTHIASITDFGAGNDVIDTHFMEKNYAQFGMQLDLRHISDTEYDLWTVDPNDSSRNHLQAVIDLATGASGAVLSSDQNSITITTPAGGGGSSVSTAESPYTAPAGVTTITLTGSNQTIHANNAGDTIWSDDTKNTLIGGTGADTFHIGRAGDTITGGGGADTFAYAQVPWGGSEITDFQPGDIIDLTGLLGDEHYSGSNPFGDGYLKWGTDSNGNAQIFGNYNQSGNNNWWLITTLDHVSTSEVTLSGTTIVWASSVSTADSPYTAPAGVTTITLTGSNQTIHANNSGDTIWSDDTKNTLVGGTGNDTFHIGRAGDTVTGGDGADTFAYATVPWGGSEITDFSSAQNDVIDLTGLLGDEHYSGSNPFGDGYLKWDDSNGNTEIWGNYNQSGNNNWWLIATVDGVSTSSLHYSAGLIT